MTSTGRTQPGRARTSRRARHRHDEDPIEEGRDARDGKADELLLVVGGHVDRDDLPVEHS
jgi:hypothetical protein